MNAAAKWQWLEEELSRLKANNLFRTLRPLSSPQRSHVIWQGRELLLLASNAYLDMCADPEVIAYTAQAVQKWGCGSGGSRLTTGTTELHTRLEEALADFKGREAAIVFNSGFAANSGVIPALCPGADDWIFSDELNHASIIDGCRGTKARCIVYRHNDMADLSQKILASGFCTRVSGHGLIVSDAVFSMDGDIVDLPGMLAAAERFGLLTMVDEAHSTGVIGAAGRGIEEHFALPGRVDILMGTLSKSLGAEGGYVCGSQALVDYLRNKCRSYIFSTSLAPATMAAGLKALEILTADPSRPARLQANVRHFCRELTAAGVPARSATAIIPIPIGDEAKAVRVSQLLLEAGIFISAIRYPTVKRGQAILRAALMSSHTETELSFAAREIAKAIARA